MLYDLSNPSDPICFEADDDRVAAAVAILLGEGAYGARREDDVAAWPVMLFATVDQTNEQLDETFGTRDLGPWFDEHAAAITAALDSLMVCRLADRKALRAAFSDLSADEERERLRRYNDERRSSLNNIAGRAAILADRLRKKVEGGP